MRTIYKTKQHNLLSKSNSPNIKEITHLALLGRVLGLGPQTDLRIEMLV